MGFLPEHYAGMLDRYGKFIDNSEPKLAWNENKFLFMSSYKEMRERFRTTSDNPLMNVPYDWTIYYLREKALTEPLTKEELAWVIMQFNQKRGYYHLRSIKEFNSLVVVIYIFKAE